MRLLKRTLVIIMSIASFASAIDWDKFNSSLLIEVVRPAGTFTCTGVAISDRIILTAAHCLDGHVNKIKIFTNERYDPSSPSLEIDHFKIHPSYDKKRSKYQSDIAKIQLKEKLPGYVRLYPIFEGKEFKGNIYRFGFGARNKKNIRTAITPTLKKLNMTQDILELNDTFSRSGDSGGPIYLEMGANMYLLAIHSTFSHGPQGNYSYNPLLGPYLPWIYAN